MGFVSIIAGFAGLAAAAGPEFTLPAFADQPVVVAEYAADPKGRAGDVVVTVENRSSRAAREVWLILAGHSCTDKLIWPGVFYSKGDDGAPGRPPIAAGGRVEIRLPGTLVRDVASVAKRTCKKAVPSELVVSGVEFVDGSRWSYAAEVRAQAGAREESPKGDSSSRPASPK